jgi:hypothetical protein
VSVGLFNRRTTRTHTHSHTHTHAPTADATHTHTNTLINSEDIEGGLVIRWSVWGRQAGQGQQATLWRHLADVVRSTSVGKRHPSRGGQRCGQRSLPRAQQLHKFLERELKAKVKQSRLRGRQGTAFRRCAGVARLCWIQRRGDDEVRGAYGTQGATHARTVTHGGGN